MISGTETLARKLDMAVIYWDMEKPAADVTASPADSSARTRRNARAQHNTQLCGNASGNYRTQPPQSGYGLTTDGNTPYNSPHSSRHTQLERRAPPARVPPIVVATTDSRISRIIVADNGSTDDSLNYVRQTFPERVEVMALGA